MSRIPAIVLIVTAFLFSHCASFSNYAGNRARDLGDVFTAGVEHRVVGVQAAAGTLALGMQFGSFGQGYGMRAGTYGGYATGGGIGEWHEPTGDSFLVINSVYHDPLDYTRPGSEHKAYHYKNVIGLISYDHSGAGGMFQFEASVGLWYGLRLGFNLLELLDFGLGIFTFDLREDDYPHRPED